VVELRFLLMLDLRSCFVAVEPTSTTESLSTAVNAVDDVTTSKVVTVATTDSLGTTAAANGIARCL